MRFTCVRTRASSSFGSTGRTMIVVDPHVEAAQQAGVVARLDDDHDRQVPRAVERADLRAEPQAVGMLEAEADDHQVEIAVGKPQQRPRRIGFALDVML